MSRIRGDQFLNIAGLFGKLTLEFFRVHQFERLAESRVVCTFALTCSASIRTAKDVEKAEWDIFIR